jgi:hypothetical protein
MFTYIEKFFPDLIERIRRLPPALKILLVVLLAASPIVASLVPAALAIIGPLLAKQYSLGGSAIIVGAVILLMVVPVVQIIAAMLRPRSTLVKFCREWTQFSDHFFLLYLKIEVYLLRDKNSAIDSKEWREIEPMMPEHWRLRGRLRKLLFLVDETRLMIQRMPTWEELRRNNPDLAENDFRTPFSFLLHIGNPIAAVNLNGKTVWAALHIAQEYLEILAYKHRSVQKALLQARKPATVNIEQARLNHDEACV